MRDMQMARDAEERAMRERQEQMRRNFDRLQVNDAGGGGYGGPPQAAPPGDAYSQVANRAAPAPPERNSSYMYGGGRGDTLPSGGGKKSVSFDANLATEMGGRNAAAAARLSETSDSSYVNYQVTVGSPEPDGTSPQFPYARGGGQPGDAVNQLFDAPAGSSGAPYQQAHAQTPYSAANQVPYNHHPGAMPPSSSQYAPPSSSQYAPPSSAASQYQPPANHQRPPSSQSGQLYQNGPQYPGGPAPASSAAYHQNGPPSSQYAPYHSAAGPGAPPQSQQYMASGYNNHQQPPHVPASSSAAYSHQQQQPPQQHHHHNNTNQSMLNTNGGVGDTLPRTPQQHSSAPTPTLVTNVDTPGVVGGQEVYRDPRDRMLAEKTSRLMVPGSGERMSFRDKMKMFASEAGEDTPHDKSKVSYAQRRIDSQLQSP